jgi:hypothetical protein
VIPAFSIGAAPRAGWGTGVCTLALLAAGGCAVWLAASGGAVPSWLAVAALVATVPALTLLRLPPTLLHWDGTRFRSDGAGGALDVAIDLGPWMLLRWRPAGTLRPWAARWLPVSVRAAGPAGWHALRCALHAPPPAPAANDG